MKPHKYRGERGVSEVRRLFAKNFTFFVKLEIRIFFSLLVKAMLLALKVMLLDAKALPLQMEAMLL